MLVPTMNMLSRFLFYDEEFNTLKAIMTGVMIGVWIWFMRMCFVQVGMYYVEAEILRIGNDSLLDSLEEGVIIQNEQTREIIYINQAATKVKGSQLVDTFGHSSIVHELEKGEIDQE